MSAFNPQFALDVMLPLAEAAYDLKKLPSSWKLISPIEPDNFAFVAESSQAVCVSFRGTKTEGEWLEDFEALPAESLFCHGHVHAGFEQQYAALHASVVAALLQTQHSKPIWITGHSLGAALALLCLADLADADSNVMAHSWAGPRVGCQDFASWFGKLHVDFYRIVNEWDVVPRVPLASGGFVHVGTEIVIDGGRPKMDDQFLKTAHNLELSYRPGLEKLVAKKAA